MVQLFVVGAVVHIKLKNIIPESPVKMGLRVCPHPALYLALLPHIKGYFVMAMVLDWGVLDNQKSSMF